jgi:hypothetical protein
MRYDLKKLREQATMSHIEDLISQRGREWHAEQNKEVDQKAERIGHILKEAANEYRRTAKPKHIWISAETMRMVEER